MRANRTTAAASRSTLQYLAPDATLPRRQVVWAAAVLAAVLVAAGCGGPSFHGNSMVLHIVAPACEPLDEFKPILVVEEVVGGSFGKAAVTKWHPMQQIEECGEPAAEHASRSGALQVWVSGFDWDVSAHVRVQLGHRVTSENVWSVSPTDRLRVDWTHLFLGVIHIDDTDTAEFVPAAGLDAVAAVVADRQGCEPGPQQRDDCEPGSWQYADPLTFNEQAPPTPETTLAS